MNLLTRRNQRDDGWFESSMTFTLDVRLDLDQEEQHFFKQYALAEVVIYNGANRDAYGEASEEHWGEAENNLAKAFELPNPVDTVSHALSGIFYLGSSTVYYLLSGASLQITLGTIVEGQHIECQSLEETLSIEQMIKEAVKYLADYVDLALTFNGGEELNEY